MVKVKIITCENIELLENTINKALNQISKTGLFIDLKVKITPDYFLITILYEGEFN